MKGWTGRPNGATASPRTVKKNNARAKRGRRTMTGSGDRCDAGRGRKCALALAILAVLLGACSARLPGFGPALESAHDSPQPATTNTPAAITARTKVASNPPNAATRIALVTTSLTPSPARRVEELTRAMTERLSAMGYEIVPVPRSTTQGERVYLVAANFEILPDAKGHGEKVGIDWLVSDALGGPVGKVSQARTLPVRPTQEQWRTETLLAAAAAAEGIARLVPVRP